MQRIHAFIRDYFGVSHREARGFLVLIGLTGLFLAYPLISHFFKSAPSNDTTVADQRKLDSLVALMKTGEASPLNNYPDRRDEADKTTAERYHEPDRRTLKLVPFNPNTASVAQWQQLGLPRWLAERIDKYRSKGGQFRRKTDLLKIYDFPPERYAQLEPYIQLPDQLASAYASRSAGPAPGGYRPNKFGAERRFSGYSTAPKLTYTRPVITPFDINMADTTQLVALKGIGAGRARQIIKFRDALGGFVSTEQFGEIFNIDSLALSELQHYARIQTPPRKININTATAADLDKHVYLSRRQAEVIVSYRNQHGPFTSVESLKPIRILDASTIDKLAPYLAF